MRKSSMLFVVLILSVLPLKAQTRFLVGPSGGYTFGNSFGGVTAGVEVPMKRFEVDLYGSYSPLEYHSPYGRGSAYQVQPYGYLKLAGRVGLIGSVERSGYKVAHLSKESYYMTAGLALSGRIDDTPTRFSFEYVRQLANGIAKDGTESSHLQGFQFSYDSRLGCKGAVCFRLRQSFIGGRVLTQSNPVCDGTYKLPTGTVPCPRTSAMGGGTTTSFRFEFPRRRATENDLF